MNLRQHKRMRIAQMQRGLFIRRRLSGFLRHLEALFRPTPEQEAKSRADFEELWKLMLPRGVADTPAAVEEAKVEYVCERVKDGVVVDSFDTREEALALLAKHTKQKKAKLQIRNSYTGLLEPFTADEMLS